MVDKVSPAPAQVENGLTTTLTSQVPVEESKNEVTEKEELAGRESGRALAEIKEDESEPSQSSQWLRFIGIGCSLLSSLLYSLSTALNRFVRDYDPFTVALWRFQAMVWPSILCIIFEATFLKAEPCKTIRPLKSKETWKTLSLLLIRGLTGLSSMIALFLAEQKIGAGNATAIGFSHPVFVSVLAWLILGESFGLIIVCAIIINIIGLFVMARPSWIFGESRDHLLNQYFEIGVLYALGTCVSLTIVFLSLRLLKNTNAFVISLAFGLVASFLSIIFLLARDIITEMPRNEMDWAVACAIGSSAFLGQCFMSLSLRFEEAAVCALLRCFDSIFAYVWGYIFFRHVPDPISIIGCIILLTGISLISARKVVEGLPVENPWRKRLCFLLK